MYSSYYKKRGIATEAEFSYGAEGKPRAEIYQLAHKQGSSKGELDECLPAP